MGLFPGILGPKRSFEGGLFLPDYKAITARRPIETLRPAGRLYVPLQALGGHRTKTVVNIGRQVLAGDPLAVAADEDAVNVAAPTSGRIVGFERVRTPIDGFLPGVVLEPDGEDKPGATNLLWEEESFLGRVVDGGVICPISRQAGHRRLREAVARGVSTLVVNAMETEPYLASDLRTLVEQPGRIVDAACEFADAMGAWRVMLAVPYRHRRVVKRLEREVRGRQVQVAALAEKYPQCHPNVLASTLLDAEVPPGGSPLDLGATIVPLAMLRGLADALLDGRAVTHVVLTVSGDAVERPGVYRVPIGMPLADLIEQVGRRSAIGQAVWGGPLTGAGLDRADAVVSADGLALLLFEHAAVREAIACVRCGWCVEDCPVGLDPTRLFQLEGLRTVDESALPYLDACIDCGLCSYVCPSGLPLSASIARTRRRVRRRAAGGDPFFAEQDGSRDDATGSAESRTPAAGGSGE